MKHVALGAIGLAAVLMAGCISTGHKFDMAAADQLKPGISTETDAISLLGEPTSREHNPVNGHDGLIWKYAYGTGIGTGAGQALAISFDERGKMIAVLQRTATEVHPF